MDFPATVAPFILRSVTLAGIDSVMASRTERLAAWQRLERDLDLTKLDLIGHEIGLADVISTATRLIGRPDTRDVSSSTSIGENLSA